MNSASVNRPRETYSVKNIYLTSETYLIFNRHLYTLRRNIRFAYLMYMWRLLFIKYEGNKFLFF